MKNYWKIALAVILLSGCGTTTNEESKSVEDVVSETAKTSDGFYGAEITENGALAMNEFVNQMTDIDSTSAKVKGNIVKTCKMKGCWMTVETAEGETMRVTFKDYGFFVPQEGMEGKEVIFEGTAKKKLTSVENLKHFAQDGGASKEEIEAITEPKEEIAFVASGVIIKDAVEANESAQE